jgi:hypothetical protein
MAQSNNGLATALSQALSERDDRAPGGDPAEQLLREDFLGMPVRAEGKPATAHIGRPPGSQNRRTRDWVKFLLTRYGSPMEVLAQMAFARVDDLKTQLGCSELEAFQEKRMRPACSCPTSIRASPSLSICRRRKAHLNPGIDAQHEALKKVMQDRLDELRRHYAGTVHRESWLA